LPQLATVSQVIRTADQQVIRNRRPVKPTLKLSTQVIRNTADDHRQHMSGQCLVTACLEALMDNVNVPKGYSFLYTDAFGYDGCFAEAVLQANVRDPGTVRSCITVCHDMESQSYVTNLVGTTVFNMAKSKELDIPDFPDLQKVVDGHPPSLNSPATLQLEATTYLPGPRVSG